MSNSDKFEQHQVHLGVVKNAEGVEAITLDQWMERNNPLYVTFIKIDTDGHEWQVLQGSENLLRSFRPTVIFEVGQYIMKEHGINFSFYFNFFNRLHYKLFDTVSGKSITLNNWKNCIPALGTIDLIALPVKIDA